MVRRVSIIRKGLPNGELATVEVRASYVLIQGQVPLWRGKTRVPMGLKASSARTTVSNPNPCQLLSRRGPTTKYQSPLAVRIGP